MDVTLAVPPEYATMFTLKQAPVQSFPCFTFHLTIGPRRHISALTFCYCSSSAVFSIASCLPAHTCRFVYGENVSINGDYLWHCSKNTWQNRDGFIGKHRLKYQCGCYPGPSHSPSLHPLCETTRFGLLSLRAHFHFDWPASGSLPGSKLQLLGLKNEAIVEASKPAVPLKATWITVKKNILNLIIKFALLRCGFFSWQLKTNSVQLW